MKAQISKGGILEVISETPIESYALKKWVGDVANSEKPYNITPNQLVIVANAGAGTQDE